MSEGGSEEVEAATTSVSSDQKSCAHALFLCVFCGYALVSRYRVGQCNYPSWYPNTGLKWAVLLANTVCAYTLRYCYCFAVSTVTMTAISKLSLMSCFSYLIVNVTTVN
jgi:hypothetical protein